jgi:DNA-binding beta-propeller fold protein YncE
MYRDSTAIQDQTYTYQAKAHDRDGNEGLLSASVGVEVVSAFRFIGTIGHSEIITPQNLLIDQSTRISLLEYDSSKLITVDTTGQIIRSITLTDTDSALIRFPTGLAIDSENDIYVSAESGLYEFDSTGRFVLKFDSTGSRTYDIAVSDSVLYTTTDGQFLKFSRNDGSLIGQFSSYGSQADQLRNAKGILVLNDSVLVCDTDNHRIQVFSTDGAHLGSWGEYGTEKGQFDQPRHLAVDSRGNILVVDNRNNRVQVLNQAGEFISVFRVENSSGNIRGISANSQDDIVLSVGNGVERYRRN